MVNEVNEGKFVRRRRTHRESRGRKFLRNFGFELLWLLVVAAGLFLLLERMSLRESLAVWARQTAHKLFERATELDDRMGALLTQVSISDLIGFALVVCAVVAILLRIRWRLMQTPGLTQIQCPHCGSGILRVHRTGLDRLIGLYVPVRRYLCRNDACGWRGLRIGRGHSAAKSKSVQSAT